MLIGLSALSVTGQARTGSAYTVEGYTPPLVLDFERSVFNANGTSSTASSAYTATRTGLATQLDASGNLVWNAHNLMTYSEDFSNAAWAKVNAGVGIVPVVTANVGIAPDGTETADRVQFDLNGGTTSGDVSRLRGSFTNPSIAAGRFWVKSNDGNTYTIGFNLGNSLDPVSVGPEWTLVDQNTSTAAGANAFDIQLRGAQTPTNSDTADLLIWGAHAYRSDLGGMAPVPLTRRVAGSTTYVPTTSAAVYLPREEAYTYVSGSLVGPYYQKESDARTNLVTYSDDFTDASWTKTNTATLALDATGPDGQANSAVTFVDSGAGGTGNVAIVGVFTVSTSTNYTYSILAKADQLPFLCIRTFLFTTGDGLTYFDLSSGSVGTTAAAHTARIENFGNGWYRCSITFTTDAADTSGQILTYVASADGGTSAPSVDLDGTSSVLIYGAQLEQGSTPTSYIPTSGSTVIRPADSTTISAGNMPYPTPQVIGPELSTGIWTGTGNTQDGITFTGDDNEYWGSSFSTTIGKVYRVSASIFNKTNNSQLRVRDGVVGAGTALTSTNNDALDAEIDYIFVAQKTVHNIEVLFRSAGVSADLSVSVREINPLALSFQMEGLMTYADNDVTTLDFYDWAADSSNYIDARLVTVASRTGQVQFRQEESNILDFVESSTTTYSPGINVPFNIASRHGSTFINGAVDGTALTADLTPTALADLSGTTFELAPTFNGFIKTFRVWGVDIGDSGIEEASQ